MQHTPALGRVHLDKEVEPGIIPPKATSGFPNLVVLVTKAAAKHSWLNRSSARFSIVAFDLAHEFKAPSVALVKGCNLGKLGGRCFKSGALPIYINKPFS